MNTLNDLLLVKQRERRVSIVSSVTKKKANLLALSECTKQKRKFEKGKGKNKKKKTLDNI